MDITYKEHLGPARKIAKQLDEKHPVALHQIARLIERVGLAQVEQWVEETHQIEAEGGLQTQAGRRRTPGGVFLHLARRRVSKDDRGYIWSKKFQRKHKKKKKKRAIQPLLWDDREPLVAEAQAQVGEVRVAKITLIGRPGRVVEKGDVVLTVMSNNNPPSLPKALPQPPSSATQYVVYIARKHWRKVAQALADDEADSLIVEGFPAFDERLKTMAVFATNVTTKQLQAARYK